MSERVDLDDFHDVPDLTVAPFWDAVADVSAEWELVSLNALGDQSSVEPVLGRQGEVGLVYPGRRHVFSGPQESAKTLVAYAVAIQVIRDGGSIVLLDFEMGPFDARNRLVDLGATKEILEGFRYVSPETPATEGRIEKLLNLAPELVIVDAAAGAYDIQGLDDNKRQDVERFTALYVRPFWKAGIATVVLDHVVKNAEGRGKYAIGSERKVGGADVHLGFEVIAPLSRGNQGLYKVVTHKDRSGYLKRGTLAEISLVSSPETHAITCTFIPEPERELDKPWLPTKIMERISTRLEIKFEPVSRQATLDENGGRAEIARQAIDALVRLGYVSETLGPHGAKLLVSVAPFRVSEWEET